MASQYYQSLIIVDSDHQLFPFPTVGPCVGNFGIRKLYHISQYVKNMLFYKLNQPVHRVGSVHSVDCPQTVVLKLYSHLLLQHKPKKNR